MKRFSDTAFSGKKEDLRSCPGQRNKVCRPGPCTRRESPVRSNEKKNGNVLPKVYNSKRTIGHESVPTDRYDAILDIPYTKSSLESCIHRNDVKRSAPAYGNNATSSSNGQTSEYECQSDLEHDNKCAADTRYLTLLKPSVLPKNSLHTKRRPSQLEALPLKKQRRVNTKRKLWTVFELVTACPVR